MDRVSPFSIPVGRHWVAIAAPGYRTLDRAIDVRFDVSIPMPLALALPGPSEAAISAMLTKGVAGPADMRGLRDIADRLGARGLVLASASPWPQIYVPAYFCDAQARPVSPDGFSLAGKVDACDVQRPPQPLTDPANPQLLP